MGARYYQPELGRWTQPDPSGQEANAYLYVGGNPVNFVDPSGLAFFQDALTVAGAAVGGLVGGSIGVGLGGGVGGVIGGCLGAALGAGAARVATGGDPSLGEAALACFGGGIPGPFNKPF